MINELEIIWKEAVVVLFKEGLRKTTRKPHS
jgi:hypothetical protein